MVGLAFFEVTWPDALLQGPASVRLIAVNANGSNPIVLVNFNPGFFPRGLTWSGDGNEVIYSIAPQTQIPGAGFSPTGEPQGAVIRRVNSVNPIAIELLPGIDAGFFPNNPMTTGSGGVDLSQIPLSLRRQGANLILSAAGLTSAATYRLESSTDLSAFGHGQNFSAQQIMDGINIPTIAPGMFFRLTTVP